MKIPLDKQAHFYSGSALSSTGYIVSESLAASVLVTVAIALAKEYIYDARRPINHTVDPLDAIATISGCVPLLFAVLLKMVTL
jgi:hypothetical protein